MLVKIVAFARYAAGGLGLYIGLSHLSSNLTYAVAITSLLSVGAVGVLSFVSHVLLHAQDAKRIGFSTKNVDFQFEVGFANLALGVTAIISYCAHWGLAANTALILAYALYLSQAGILHTVKSLRGKKIDMVHLIRGGAITFIYSGAMLYIALKAITSNLS